MDGLKAVSTDDGRMLLGEEIANAKVTATVTGHDRGPKTIVFKFKRKKQYKRTYGHRQNYTELMINDVVV
jgi:large subunit ribosomal protein L21